MPQSIWLTKELVLEAEAYYLHNIKESSIILVMEKEETIL